MGKKFGGKLNWVDPKLLVDENNHNKVDGFFITLGVVFNDLNGLLMFESLLVSNYEKPETIEATNHAGHYWGLLLQVHKLLVSTISEFFVFLKKSTDVFSEVEFKQVLERLSKSDESLWSGVVAAAHGRLNSVNSFLNAIVQIRSNIAFHYDHSGKVFRGGYISKFFGKNRDDSNKSAYYSLNDNPQETRFFFSDAAAEECLNIAAGKKFKDSPLGDPAIKEYRAKIGETIVALNRIISILLKNYIQKRRNRPRC